MAGTSIIHRFRRAARRFVRADRGNIAVIFAVACVPLISFVGAAVDYSRLNAARSSLQAALDSTALMVSKDLTAGVITNSQISTAAQNYFSALYAPKGAAINPISATYTAGSGSTTSKVLVTRSGSITTDFMKLAGFPTLPFDASSTATWGNVKMRVALALDNTGSMAQNGKITALGNAVAGSGGLIDQLSALAKNNGDVYISVVPFAKVVNVGASNSGQSWIDWNDWLNPPTSQPNNGSYQATLPMNWHGVGPGARCPFTTSSGGFTCNTSLPAHPTHRRFRRAAPIRVTFAQASTPTLMRFTMVAGTVSQPAPLEYSARDPIPALVRSIPRGIRLRVAAAVSPAASSHAPATFMSTTGRSPVMATQRTI